MPLHLQIIIAAACVAVAIAIIIIVSVAVVRRHRAAAVKSVRPRVEQSSKSSVEDKVQNKPNTDKAENKTTVQKPAAKKSDNEILSAIAVNDLETKSSTRQTLEDGRLKLSERDNSYFSTLLSVMRSLENTALKVSPYAYILMRNEKTLAKLTIVARVVILDCTVADVDNGGVSKRMRFKVVDEKSLHAAIYTLRRAVKNARA